MRVIELKAYQFKELSKEAQREVLDRMSDLNTSYDWWNPIYEDAENVGIKIDGFDIENRRELEFTTTGHNSWIDAARLMVENHGEQCGTYKAAKKLLEFNTVALVTCTLNPEGDSYHESDDTEETGEFQDAIGDYYHKALKNEYTYQCSDEAIVETIEANEYEFEEDGTQI